MVVARVVEEAAKKTTIILRATIYSASCAEGKGTLFRGVSRASCSDQSFAQQSTVPAVLNKRARCSEVFQEV
jgi:hypothetical protein